MRHISFELAEIAVSTSAVQHALGKTMDQISDLCEVPIIEFQSLDWMQQKLEDLSKLSQILSDNVAIHPRHQVELDLLRNTLQLTSLVDRLTSLDQEKPNDASGTTESSFTLF